MADGQRQAAVLEAQGAGEAAILRADGFALALDKVFAVAREVDSKTMALQYLDALRAIGAGPATKFIIPAELANLLRPFEGYAARAGNGVGREEPASRDPRDAPRAQPDRP